MSRHAYNADGERVDARDVLDDQELADLARTERNRPRVRRYVPVRTVEDYERAYENWLDRIGGSA